MKKKIFIEWFCLLFLSMLLFFINTFFFGPAQEFLREINYVKVWPLKLWLGLIYLSLVGVLALHVSLGFAYFFGCILKRWEMKWQN